MTLLRKIIKKDTVPTPNPSYTKNLIILLLKRLKYCKKKALISDQLPMYNDKVWSK